MRDSTFHLNVVDANFAMKIIYKYLISSWRLHRYSDNNEVPLHKPCDTSQVAIRVASSDGNQIADKQTQCIDSLYI